MLFTAKRGVTAASAAAVLALTAFAGGASAQDPTSDYKPGSTPGSGTNPTSVKSGRAALASTRKCTKTSFPVTVSGRSMRRVTIYVNGRLAKRVTVKSTATRVTTKLPTPVATSKLTIKVTFVSATGTKAKTFTRTVKRCVPASVSPKFTG